jgi:hypothetical protein
MLDVAVAVTFVEGFGMTRCVVTGADGRVASVA